MTTSNFRARVHRFTGLGDVAAWPADLPPVALRAASFASSPGSPGLQS